MKTFSRAWKSSTNRRKQRKYQKNAPLHVKQQFTAAHLSKELRKKYKGRSSSLRKGYTVKIMRGQYKKKTGKIVSVDLRSSRVTIEGIQQVKRDGTKAFYPIHPSNLQIIELTTDDKKTRVKLEGAKK